MELNMRTASAELVKKDEEKASNCDLKVADAVWIGTALLHEKQPEYKGGFATEDIVAFVSDKRLTKGAYKSIWQHVNQHCVANRPPQPNRARMLFALVGGNRRLFRSDDKSKSDPGREGAPTHPQWDQLPAQYQYLKQWYEEWDGAVRNDIVDPLLDLMGTWKNEHADEYVARLRENWGESR
jgi:hypothetical protein